MRKEKLFYPFFIVLICYDTKTFFLHDMNGKKLISINLHCRNITHIIYLLSKSMTCQIFDVDLSLLKQCQMHRKHYYTSSATIYMYSAAEENMFFY